MTNFNVDDGITWEDDLIDPLPSETIIEEPINQTYFGIEVEARVTEWNEPTGNPLDGLSLGDLPLVETE